jgi:hypothetical protein
MRDPLTEPARPGATAHAGLAAFRHLVALGIDDPLILGVLPWDRADPFAALLYRHAWAHGVAPVALDGLDDLDALLPLRTLGASVVLHLHRTDLNTDVSPIRQI